MTLATYVGFLDPFTPAEAHAWANEHLLKAPDARLDSKGDWSGTGPVISNHPGQGLDAWLITHGAGNKLVEWFDKDHPENAEYYLDYPQIYGYLDFDTAYGYRGPNGLGCSELHALYIMRLIEEYAEPRGLRITWRNEFTGEWFLGTDGLETLVDSGESAQDWFKNVVKPLFEEGLL